MPKLIATKSFLYNTRRLLAGDEFEPVKPVHGRLLIAAKKAREVRTPGKVAPPPAALAKKVAPAADDEIAAARAEYQEKVGKRPFMGWDVETLRAKMAEAVEPAPDPEPAAEVEEIEAAVS
jgi:hypothetical protein